MHIKYAINPDFSLKYLNNLLNFTLEILQENSLFHL